MAHPILMPRPGQMTEECTLLAWHKDEGDPVRKGDVLFEIETDKATMEVEAFVEGVLLRQLVEAGQTVPVNAVCAYVGEPGERLPETDGAGVVPDAAPQPRAAPFPEPTEPPPVGAAADAAAPRAAGRVRTSPRARRLASEAGIDLASVAGSGPAGRIVERDVRAALERLAAGQAGTSAGPPQVVREPPAALPVEDGDGARQPLSRMRRLIAERMSLSTSTAPQFTVTVSVDVSRLMALRQRLKEAGRSLSVTDFLVLAAAQSLVEFPLVNSRTDGTDVWLRRRVHVGLAVSVPDGLVVVVLRDADHLTLDEIHERSAALIAGARAGTLKPDDLSGSTFSISNLGMYGVDEFTAIINPGESAILAVGSAAPRPVVIGDGIGVRTSMRVTLTADHRLIDGELAARFLDDLRRRLEAPEPLASRSLT